MSVMDPNCQIKGDRWSPRTLDRGGRERRGSPKTFFQPFRPHFGLPLKWSYWPHIGHSSSVVYYKTMKDLPLNVATGTWVTRVYNLWIESSSSFLLRARRILTLKGTFLENQNKNSTLKEMSLAKTIPV